jgi:N-acetylmuramoyl-L-alanine amidase
MGYNLLVDHLKGVKMLAPFFSSGEEGELHPEAEQTPEPLEEAEVRPNKRFWILDPGHGPRTVGKRSPMLPDGRRFYEYHFTREVTKNLIRLLQDEGVSYAVTVPLGDRDVGNDLPRRTNFENNYPAEYPKAFLSIHSNAGKVPDPYNDWSSANGIETWHYFRPGNSEHHGKQFARVFQKHLVEEFRLKDRGLKFTDDTKINPETGKKYTQLWVLRKTFSPAVLVEIGFYNNLEEVQLLLDPTTPERAAKALFAAMVEIENNISLR